jgi:hypothetical protein
VLLRGASGARHRSSNARRAADHLGAATAQSRLKFDPAQWACV